MDDRILYNQSHIDHHQKMVVDFYLFTPLNYLAEALLHPVHAKALMDLFSFCITSKAKLGKTGLLSWLNDKPEFHQTEAIENILKKTPLGNPAWFLLGNQPEKTSELLRDIESLIPQISATEDLKSLRSIIQEFIQRNPKYGNADAVASFLGKTRQEILDEWQPQWTTFKSGETDPRCMLGQLTTQLMLLQMAATPPRPKLKPGEDLDDYPKHVIYRPDFELYKIAMREMMVGTCLVDMEVWQEMLSLYHTKTYTNFLPFAPLFLQPFKNSYPVSLNTLSILLGNYSSRTSTFIGDANKNALIRWNTLGLTIGKLAITTGVLPPVLPSINEQPQELTSNLDSKTKIYGPTKQLTSEAAFGRDLGWHIVSDDMMHHRWDIQLGDIAYAVNSNRITFNKFSKVKESSVFNRSRSLTRLDWWFKRQMRQETVYQLSGIEKPLTTCNELLQILMSDFSRRELPPMKAGGMATNGTTVSPSSTSKNTLHHGQSNTQSLRKVSSSAPASAEAAKTSKCRRSNCVEHNHDDMTTSGSRKSQEIQVQASSVPCSGKARPAANISNSASSPTSDPDPSMQEHDEGNGNVGKSKCREKRDCTPKRPNRRSPLPSTTCHHDRQAIESGIYFIAEPFKGDNYRKDLVSRLRIHEAKVLKAKSDLTAGRRELKLFSDEQLRQHIKDKIDLYLGIEIEGIGGRNKAERIGALEESFAELVLRDLGIKLPNLVGLKSEAEITKMTTAKIKPLNFRYRFGDEEAVAAHMWSDVIDEGKEEHEKCPIGATKAARNVWTAMTVIYISLHLKKQGIEWSVDALWNFPDFRRFPFFKHNLEDIMSLVPHLYWTLFLKEEDKFRVRPPNMASAIFVPTARVSYFEDFHSGLPAPFAQEDMNLFMEKIGSVPKKSQPTPIPTKTPTPDPYIIPIPSVVEYLPKRLSDTRVSSLSLCENQSWQPDNILKSAEHYFGIEYSVDKHPEKTKYLRLYVKLGVEKLLARLSNPTTISFLANATIVSKTLGELAVALMYDSYKNQLEDWYDNFVDEFVKKWRIFGGEWVSIDLPTETDLAFIKDEKAKAEIEKKEKRKKRRAKLIADAIEDTDAA